MLRLSRSQPPPEDPHEAAVAGFQRRPDKDGLLPCTGYHGVACQNQSWVKKNQRCRTCDELQNAPRPTAFTDITDPWVEAVIPSGGQAPEVEAAECPKSTDEHEQALLDQAEEVAMLLARRGEEGFRHLIEGDHPVSPHWQECWSIAQKTLYRLAFISDLGITKIQESFPMWRHRSFSASTEAL